MLIPAYALESIWYSDKDLKEDNIQRIPHGYLDPSSIDPCSTKNYDKPLSLVDVTEAALCNNPQTREVYANARVQAAQVGVARSLFFPSVTDTLSATENKNRTTNYLFKCHKSNRSILSFV
jgi:outer membrane protein